MATNVICNSGMFPLVRKYIPRVGKIDVPNLNYSLSLSLLSLLLLSRDSLFPLLLSPIFGLVLEINDERRERGAGLVGYRWKSRHVAVLANRRRVEFSAQLLLSSPPPPPLSYPIHPVSEERERSYGPSKNGKKTAPRRHKS